MNVTCSATPCPVILNATCVFYEGANLVYTGINNNDNLQTALEKIDAKFGDAAIGYIFNNGVIQSNPGDPVQLGGSLIQDTVINSAGFDFTFTGNIYAAKHITTGGTSSQFVKGDGTLDGTSYQPSGSYLTALTGDGTATGPGSAVFTLANTSVVANTYGSSTQVPVFTVDSKGRITNVTDTAIAFPAALLFFTGDVTGTGTTGAFVTLTLQTVNTNVYGSNTFLKFAVNGKGLVTSAAPVGISDIIGALGYTPVPQTRTLTINGVTYNLSANRSWTIPGGGTVTSVAVTSGTGISASVANPTTTPNITITNTAPDQTVVLNSGSGISVSGTYPNFTISATGASGFSYTVVPVTSTPYNAAQTSGNIIILVDAATAGSNVIINLPTPVGNGAQFTVKKIDSGSNTVTLNPGAFTIDGDTSAIIYYQNTSGTIISDNANWKIIN